MCEGEPLFAENIGLKDIARSRRGNYSGGTNNVLQMIARSRRGELISREELIMYYRSRALN